MSCLNYTLYQCH